MKRKQGRPKTVELLAPDKDNGELIVSFGDAKLIKLADGKYELRGGSKEDRSSVREWVSLFCHHAVVRESP